MHRLLMTICVVFGILFASGVAATGAISATNGAAPALVPCTNLLVNGNFETPNTGWTVLPGTDAPTYVNVPVNTGATAMRLGNVDQPNVFSQSYAVQTVTLPNAASEIILDFHYFPIYDAQPGLGDLQYLDIYENNAPIARVLGTPTNAGQWLFKQVDLTTYAGRTLDLRFEVVNDGNGGRTAMYLDDVVIRCDGELAPPPNPATVTATATSTAPGNTPTSTTVPSTPTPTAPPANAGCVSVLNNGGFEGNGGWIFGQDPVPPRYVGDPVYDGARSILLGNPPGGGSSNTVSYSSIRQLVTVPHHANEVRINWRALYKTEETVSESPGRFEDRHDLITLSANHLETIEVVRRIRYSGNDWQEMSATLDPAFYRGKTFYIYFNAYNAGHGARTWMYLDGLDVQACSDAIPPATAYPATAYPTAASPTNTSIPPTVETPVAPKPDLHIFHMSIEHQAGSCDDGGDLGVRVTVENKGGADAAPFKVNVNGTQQQVAGLPAGASTGLWTSGYINGNNVATVDVGLEIDESDEFNNTSNKILPVPTPPAVCTPGTATITPTDGSTVTSTVTSPTGTVTPTPQTPTSRLGTFAILLGILVAIGLLALFLVWFFGSRT